MLATYDGGTADGIWSWRGQILITLDFGIPMGAIPSPLELRCDPIFNGPLGNALRLDL